MSDDLLKETVARNSSKRIVSLTITSSFGRSSGETKGIVRPSTVFTKILVARAPLFSTLIYWVFCSPNITSPKSTSGVSTYNKAFLQVHSKGISMSPVSARMGNTALISWFSWGVNVIRMVVERPALMRPVGV